MFWQNMVTNILTVDVEDNFYLEELKDKKDWNKYERQVVDNTLKILDIFENYKTRATFFIVGKVAERHPDLIREICRKNHSIASHSYSHYPISILDESAFRRDLEKSIHILSRLVHKQIFGFRAMGYSVSKENIEWVFKNLNESGIKYDSSINPMNMPGYVVEPNYLEKFKLYEFPVSVYTFGRTQFPFAGGTHLRLLPYKVIETFMQKLNKRGKSVTVYIHPWEFNKDQPRRNVSLKQRILQHPFTFNTEKKLIKLLKNFQFHSIEDYLIQKNYL